MAIGSELRDAFIDYFNMLQTANQVYNTPLSNTEEEQYQMWKEEQQRADEDVYDLRGHFKKFILGGAGQMDEYGAYAREAAEAARKAGSLGERQRGLGAAAGEIMAGQKEAEAAQQAGLAEGAAEMAAAMPVPATSVNPFKNAKISAGIVGAAAGAAAAEQATQKPLAQVPTPVADQVAEFMKPTHEQFSEQSMYYNPELGIDPLAYIDYGAA